MNLIKILQIITKQKILLPFYHTVAEEPLPHIKHLYTMKTVKEFTEDLNFLLKYFEPIDAETLFHFNINKIVPKKPVFHLTFDDGLKGIYEIVAPILLQKGIPATFFINSGFTDNKRLFYRFHASLSIEELLQKEKLTESLRKEILSCSYKDRNNLFQYFSQPQIDEFLKQETPYLTTEQIQSLNNQGFTIGAHSVDHPCYCEIPFHEQLRQTFESLEFIASIVTQKLKLFAFPFTDFNISKHLFEEIKPFIDLSFGTAGMKNDKIPFNYQRIAGEKDRFITIKSVLKKEYLKYLEKSCLKKNVVHRKYNLQLYNDLRNKYSVFYYEHFDFQVSENRIIMQFLFKTGNYEFKPSITLKLGRYAVSELKKEEMAGLVFHIGMIELISYWKAVCSPVIHIHNHSLTPAQQQWWKKIYWKGLGEFFYQNGIENQQNNFVDFRFDDDAVPLFHFQYKKIKNEKKVIVPIGGGKDSVVTLERLRIEKEVIPFIINPRGATLDCAYEAGYKTEEDIVILEREIDPLLLILNDQGFLNGHTPFSAMLAFYTLLVSYGVDTRKIALSNESSANEATIPETTINHQYSKSIEFEEDFRQYVFENMNDCSLYYSYLRPYSELQIAEMFARYKAYHPVFRSCNTGSKQNIWCCNCAKCLFAYIILSPFLSNEEMIAIFGEDLLNKEAMIPYFDQLTGLSSHKPFECVGTIDEVNEALRLCIERDTLQSLHLTSNTLDFPVAIAHKLLLERYQKLIMDNI